MNFLCRSNFNVARRIMPRLRQTTFVPTRSLHEVQKLHFHPDSLEPYLSEKNIANHWRLYRGYVEKLNDLIEEHKEIQLKPLDETILITKDQPKLGLEYKMASECHSHASYFSQFTDELDQRQLSPFLEEQFALHFETVEHLKKRLAHYCSGMMGSGWVWLVAREGQVDIITIPLGESILTFPGATDIRPLLVLDASEHAFWSEFGHDYDSYVEAWWQCCNFQRVEQTLKLSMRIVGLIEVEDAPVTPVAEVRSG